MLTSQDVASHWPFIESHLELDRKPAMARALRLLAEGQAWHDGRPVALSRSRLAALGLTPGEAGRVWAVLDDLETRGVVFRYRGGGGRRPDLWSLTPSLGQKWKMPWRRSGREVEMIIERCSCRAATNFAARFPAPGVVSPRDNAIIRLSPEAHLGKHPQNRAATDCRRAATTFYAPPTRESLEVPRGWEPPLYQYPGGTSTTSSSLDLERGSLEAPEDTDGALRTLEQAVTRATGGTLYGAPREALRKVALRCNGQIEAVASELEAQTHIRSAPVLASMAEAILNRLSVDTHQAETARGQSAAKRMAYLEMIGEDGSLNVDTEKELEDLRRSLLTPSEGTVTE